MVSPGPTDISYKMTANDVFLCLKIIINPHQSGEPCSHLTNCYKTDTKAITNQYKKPVVITDLPQQLNFEFLK